MRGLHVLTLAWRSGSRARTQNWGISCQLSELLTSNNSTAPSNHCESLTSCHGASGAGLGADVLHPGAGSFAARGYFEQVLRGFQTSASIHDAEQANASNQPPRSWLNDWLPARAVPYAQLMRLDKPAGTWLLAWPCMWSIAMAAPPGSIPDLHLVGLFGAGAVLLRGAGCTVNDLWDMRLDALVARTRSRPLASGALSIPQAVGLLGAQLLLGLGILVQLNTPSILLGASSLLLVGTYPYMKRITYWPQAFLGITFNWGALLGYVAAAGHLDYSICLPLYASGVCWTLVYDTIYAHQDKTDDVIAGVKSTALLFGDHNRLIMAAFACSHLSLMALAGLNAELGPGFAVAMLAASAHVAWQILTVDLNSRPDCLSKFNSNQYYGALIFGGIVADKMLC